MISATGKNKAFSLIELMVTVVIISVGLSFVLRAFSVCASYITKAQNRVQGALILEDLLAELREKELKAEDLKSESGKVKVGGRYFNWMQKVSKWQVPSEGFLSSLAPTEDESGGQPESSLDQVSNIQLSVYWSTRGVKRTMEMETLMIQEQGL